MKTLMNFDYQGTDVRAIMRDGEPWFVLADVCRILELKEPHRVAERLECDEKDRTQMTTPGGSQEMTIINESGLYAVILRSDKPQARPFRKWVTGEVLPQIRKTGVYDPRESMGYEKFFDPAYVEEALSAIRALQADQAAMRECIAEHEATIAIQGQQIAEMRPKATYYDIVLNSVGTVPITVIAKDYGLSAQKMNELLNQLHVQYKVRGVWVLYQEHAGKNYTDTETGVYDTGTGANGSWTHTYWTQAGRLFIYETLKRHGILPMVERVNISA